VSGRLRQVLLAAAATVLAPGLVSGQRAPDDPARLFPERVSQGALVIGKVPAGSRVELEARTLRVTDYGTVVFGVARDRVEPVSLDTTGPDGVTTRITLLIEPRDWPVEHVSGLPPGTVSPPPRIAARIAREQARVNAARERDDARADFAAGFIWPLRGRISGRFGYQRVYNGQPGSAHSGLDIAAPAGTPVRAPAAGLVTLAEPDLYLTGGTLLIDHGHGISSNFLHLSRLDVDVGERVEQGRIIGAVGATGRASGPHLHWGMNWFEVRIDPLLAVRDAD